MIKTNKSSSSLKITLELKPLKITSKIKTSHGLHSKKYVCVIGNKFSSDFVFFLLILYFQKGLRLSVAIKNTQYPHFLAFNSS